MANTDCVRCELLESLDRLDTEQLIDEQLKLEIGNLVPDEIRDARLKICASCPFFQNGMCLKCGCYTRFRTSLKNKTCPIKKWN